MYNCDVSAAATLLLFLLLSTPQLLRLSSLRLLRLEGVLHRLLEGLLTFEGKLGKLSEGLLHVKVRFGARLDEEHVALLLAEPLELLMRDGSLLSLEIKLVRNHQEREGVRLIDHTLGEEGVLPV